MSSPLLHYSNEKWSDYPVGFFFSDMLPSLYRKKRDLMVSYVFYPRRRNSESIIPVAIATFSDSEVGESAG